MTKNYFMKNFSKEFTHYFSTDKVVGLPNKVRRDAHKVPSHGTESEKSLKVKKKFYLSIQMWFLAFDSQEICCTHGEKENIDKYNTGAMKIHLNVKRDT